MLQRDRGGIGGNHARVSLTRGASSKGALSSAPEKGSRLRPSLGGAHHDPPSSPVAARRPARRGPRRVRRRRRVVRRRGGGRGARRGAGGGRGRRRRGGGGGRGGRRRGDELGDALGVDREFTGEGSEQFCAEVQALDSEAAENEE